MGIEKVEGPKGPKPQEKKERTSTPDSEEFREMMRTGKVSETEFEKPKKKKQQAQKGGLGEKREPPPTTKGSTLPSPFDSYSQTQPTAPTEPYYLEEKPPTPETEKEKRKEKKKEKEELAAYQKKTLKQAPKTLKKEEEKVKKPSLEIKETKAQKPKIEEPIKEIKVPKEKEEKQKKITPQVQQSTVLQEMPPNIATQTQSITETLTPYLHPDIIPLFEKMVGAVIQLQAKGTTTTELMLNSPAFQSSVFFGSSIVVQKYSTAPAFNIFLRGPTQAINMFSENLDGLLDAFKKANINIGRLEAQHEKFTFRRKEKPSGKKDSGPQR